jgi:hypothetical protein
MFIEGCVEICECGVGYKLQDTQNIIYLELFMWLLGQNSHDS